MQPQVRTDNAVQVSQTLALDINSFFDSQTQAQFIANLCRLLGISPSQVCVCVVMALL